MPFGLLTGLGAAITWGTLDIFSALATRRVGSLRVTTGIQVIGAIAAVAIAIVSGTVFPTDPGVVLGGMLVGLIGAGSALAYFTGLRIGPIAIVSGMVAAYGGLTVVLAVLIRGETLTVVQALGAAVSTVGVILTGLAFDGSLRGARFASPGVAFAIVALVLFAMMAIAMDIMIDHTDWLSVLLVSRTTNALASVGMLVVALTIARRFATPLLIGTSADVPAADSLDAGIDHELGIDHVGPDGERAARRHVASGPRSARPHWGRRVVAFVLLAGILDIVGLLSFMIGLERAQTWLVGLASSFGPAITIVIAVVFLGERLRRLQWIGIGSILVGMVLIGVP
jgi:drug/metabolite transporter (DMT)-like permease